MCQYVEKNSRGTKPGLCELLARYQTGTQRACQTGGETGSLECNTGSDHAYGGNTLVGHLDQSWRAKSGLASSLSNALACDFQRDGFPQNIGTAILARGVTKNCGTFRTGAKTCVLMPKPRVGQNRVFRREYLLISRVNCTQATATIPWLSYFWPQKKMGPSWPSNRCGSQGRRISLASARKIGFAGSQFALTNSQGKTCNQSMLKRWSIGRSSD